VIAEDVTAHPNWTAFAELAVRAGLCACWSQPIRATSGKILGAFAIYHRSPRQPDAKDLRLIEFAAETVALVIEHKQAEAELESYRLKLEDQVAIRTRELVLARDLAETANRAKSDFLANMSHELRTPLNAVLGFSDLLRRDPRLAPAQRENLNIIHRSGKHLLGLINDILDMVKIDSGHIRVRLAPFDVAGLVGGVADTLRARADAKGVGLRVERAEPMPRYVRSDEAKLRQALFNLADNAIKYTDVGEVVLRVEVVAGPASPWLSVEVRDSGIGIAPGDQRRIFDPFVQAGRQDTQQGTGLGLPITRQFIEMLGGRVEVISELGRGSRFRIELPVEPVEEAEAQQVGEEAREVVGLEPGQPDHRILIVDDQPENALLLNRLLETVGFRARVAENGARGVELFNDWHPDFIWMDWRMPVLDGLEATRRIRAAPGGDAVKIVAITASVPPEQEEQILAAGVDDIVRKPYPFRAIFDCLARHLGVRYLCRKREAAPPAEPPADGALVATGLAELPEDLQRELAVALVALDCARIDELIDRVAERNAELAKILRQHADAFDYDPLVQALTLAKAADAAA
jgi:signal transduction histidine kinase/DNA-binding NarL/FixJ family response regulator